MRENEDPSSVLTLSNVAGARLQVFPVWKRASACSPVEIHFPVNSNHAILAQFEVQGDESNKRPTMKQRLLSVIRIRSLGGVCRMGGIKIRIGGKLFGRLRHLAFLFVYAA